MAALELHSFRMPNEIAYHRPRNIASMPRRPVRCLFFRGIVSGRCLPERKTWTWAERRRGRRIKRVLYSSRNALPRKASRRFGNRKSRNTEITQREGEKKKGGERERESEPGNSVEQSVTGEESPSYYSRQPLCEALQNERHIDRQSMRSQTNKHWKESRSTAINMREYSSETVRRHRKERYCGKKCNKKKKIEIENFSPVPDVTRIKSFY